MELFVGVVVLIAVVTCTVVGVIVAGVVFGLRQWHRNNAAPELTIPVVVAAKRAETSGGMGDTSASTRYFVTFERESGERCEFHVRAKDYAMIAERDRGLLTYQGTRFKGFDRALRHPDITGLAF
jgi:hypothetical protein